MINVGDTNCKSNVCISRLQSRKKTSGAVGRCKECWWKECGLVKHVIA